jgi:hypothetical protein
MGSYCMKGQLYASDIMRSGKAIFGGESDPQFLLRSGLI